MRQVNRIDANGYYVEPIVLDDGEVLTETVTDADGNLTVQPRADIVEAPVPEGLFLPKWDGAAWVEGKPDADVLPVLKQRKIDEIKAACQADILAGFTSASKGYRFGFAEKDQMNFTQQLLLFVSDPSLTDVQWKTDDAGVVTLTKAEFLTVIGEADAHKRGKMAQCWTTIDNINATTTKTQLDAIAW